MSLESKKIVVTGAASGIGAETVKTLKAQGATVIGVDRNEPKENVDQYIKADLADPDSIAAAVETVPSGIDALCNIAGLPPTKCTESQFPWTQASHRADDREVE